MEGYIVLFGSASRLLAGQDVVPNDIDCMVDVEISEADAKRMVLDWLRERAPALLSKPIQIHYPYDDTRANIAVIPIPAHTPVEYHTAVPILGPVTILYRAACCRRCTH